MMMIVTVRIDLYYSDRMYRSQLLSDHRYLYLTDIYDVDIMYLS